MNNMTFNHTTEFSSMVFKAFSMVARKMNIQQGFTNGVEIYYTDPVPIDQYNKYGSYSLLLFIDKQREVTHVDMVIGNRADLLNKIQGLQQQRPQSTLHKVNSIDITKEFKTQLASNQSSVVNNNMLNILYNEINMLLNSTSSGYGQGDVLITLANLLYVDLEDIMQFVNQLTHSMYEDMNSIMEFLTYGQSVLNNDIILNQGVFSSIKGFEYKATPYVNYSISSISWDMDVQPGYTLMRSVKDDMAFSNLNKNSNFYNNTQSTQSNWGNHGVNQKVVTW